MTQIITSSLTTIIIISILLKPACVCSICVSRVVHPYSPSAKDSLGTGLGTDIRGGGVDDMFFFLSAEKRRGLSLHACSRDNVLSCPHGCTYNLTHIPVPILLSFVYFVLLYGSYSCIYYNTSRVQNTYLLNAVPRPTWNIIVLDSNSTNTATARGVTALNPYRGDSNHVGTRRLCTNVESYS